MLKDFVWNEDGTELLNKRYIKRFSVRQNPDTATWHVTATTDDGRNYTISSSKDRNQAIRMCTIKMEAGEMIERTRLEVESASKS